MEKILEMKKEHCRYLIFHNPPELAEERFSSSYNRRKQHLANTQ
jgi:hypothetical protein